MKSEFRSQNSEFRKGNGEAESSERPLPPSPVDIYERTFDFSCRVLRFYMAYEKRAAIPKTLLTQLLNSGTAVGSNLQEGKSAESRADFVHKARIALKEARESHYWLRLFEKCELAPGQLIQPLVTEANAIVAILTTIVKRTSARGAMKVSRSTGRSRAGRET